VRNARDARDVREGASGLSAGSEDPRSVKVNVSFGKMGGGGACTGVVRYRSAAPRHGVLDQPVEAVGSDADAALEKTHRSLFLLNFSYACPEPVLVN
jgi:hypothetical protein